MALQTLALFFLGTLAAGGVVWVFVYPLMSGERQAEKHDHVLVSGNGGVLNFHSTAILSKHEQS